MAASKSRFLPEIESYTGFLGHGGFGIVLKAMDSAQYESAIKFIFPKKDDDIEKKRFLIECNITTALEKHQNIVSILNFEEKNLTVAELEKIIKILPLNDHQLLSKADAYLASTKRHGFIESFCIQMEICGEDLKTWLAQVNDISDPNMQYMQMVIPQNIIRGLKFLHDNKIIHRDLKPANILFSSSNYCLPVKIGGV